MVSWQIATTVAPSQHPGLQVKLERQAWNLGCSLLLMGHILQFGTVLASFPMVPGFGHQSNHCKPRKGIIMCERGCGIQLTPTSNNTTSNFHFQPSRLGHATFQPPILWLGAPYFPSQVRPWLTGSCGFRSPWSGAASEESSRDHAAHATSRGVGRRHQGWSVGDWRCSWANMS